MLFNRIRVKNGYNGINCIALKSVGIAEIIEEMKGIFEAYNKDNKYLLIDSGGYDGDINRYAMLGSDLLITPVSPSQVEVFGLQKYMAILKEISVKSGQVFKTNVVINNADARSQGALAELKGFINENSEYINLYNTVVYSRAVFKQAYGVGLGVVEWDANCKAACELLELIEEIKKDF